jgi:PAS domain S-box-containing protein
MANLGLEAARIENARRGINDRMRSAELLLMLQARGCINAAVRTTAESPTALSEARCWNSLRCFMGKPIRVLLIEASDSDAALLIGELQRSGYEPRAERVESRDGMVAALKRQPWDVVIADYHLPQFSAAEALELLRQRQLDIPFIVLSGSIPEEAGAAMMEQGADDYVMKNNLARLVPAIERELCDAADRRGFRFTQGALRESQIIREAVLGAVESPVIVVNPDGRIVDFNPAAQETFARAEWDARGRLLTELAASPSDQRTLQQRLLSPQEDASHFEFHALRGDGATVTVEIALHRDARSQFLVCVCEPAGQHAPVPRG